MLLGMHRGLAAAVDSSRDSLTLRAIVHVSACASPFHSCVALDLMRIFPVVFLIGVLRVSTLGQTPSATPARPPDLPAENWIAISPMLGLVITEDAPGGVTRFSTDPATGKQTAERTVPDTSVVRGYFMVLRHGQWLRVEIEPPAARGFRTR